MSKGLRAVSQYRNYDGPTAQDEKVMVLQTGDRQVIQKGLIARPWRHGDVTEWERKQALDHWQGKLRGLTEGEDPLNRLSSFDSLWAQQVNDWTDEERIKVEERVLSGPGAGVDYVVIESPKAPIPYKLYDEHRKVHGRRTVEHAIKSIQDAYANAGFDVAQAVQYEKENLNDSQVVAALEVLAAEVQESDELVEA